MWICKRFWSRSYLSVKIWEKHVTTKISYLFDCLKVLDSDIPVNSSDSSITSAELFASEESEKNGDLIWNNILEMKTNARRISIILQTTPGKEEEKKGTWAQTEKKNVVRGNSGQSVTVPLLI